MKLRAKLVIYTANIAIVAVILCALLAAGFSRERMLEDTTVSCLESYNGFYTAFSASAAQQKGLPSEILENHLQYQFHQIKGSNEFVLQKENMPLINNTGIDPVKLLLRNSPQTYPATEILYGVASYEDSTYFIVTDKYSIGAETYSISLVRDITQPMQGIAALVLRCIGAGLLVAALAVALIFAVISHSLKPIGKLKRGARELAGGNYENRIHIKSKDELSELAEDFNSMANAIEGHICALNETAERQRMFISGLSHELKTPVTSVMISANTLYTRKISEEDQKRSLKRIYEQCRWLERLSGKLTTLVLLQGEIELKQESVAELFEAVSETMTEALSGKNISLITDCRIDTLPMDFDLMQSAVVNLVDNARKASANGGTIELRAFDNTIEIADYGCGIPPGELSRIFEPFYMIDRSRNKKNGGSGLGLSLVQKIVEAHHARLMMESETGKGTTVRITFNDV